MSLRMNGVTEDAQHHPQCKILAQRKREINERRMRDVYPSYLPPALKGS